MSNYFVYDPSPAPEGWPTRLYGPTTKERAEQFANLLHSEDGDGGAVVLQAVPIEEESADPRWPGERETGVSYEDGTRGDAE